MNEFQTALERLDLTANHANTDKNEGVHLSSHGLNDLLLVIRGVRAGQVPTLETVVYEYTDPILLAVRDYVRNTNPKIDRSNWNAIAGAVTGRDPEEIVQALIRRLKREAKEAKGADVTTLPAPKWEPVFAGPHRYG